MFRYKEEDEEEEEMGEGRMKENRK